MNKTSFWAELFRLFSADPRVSRQKKKINCLEIDWRHSFRPVIVGYAGVAISECLRELKKNGFMYPDESGKIVHREWMYMGDALDSYKKDGSLKKYKVSSQEKFDILLETFASDSAWIAGVACEKEVLIYHNGGEKKTNFAGVIQIAAAAQSVVQKQETVGVTWKQLVQTSAFLEAVPMMKAGALVAGSVYTFLTKKQMQGNWEIHEQLLREDASFADASTVRAQKGIKKMWWNLSWIPVAGDGAGNFLCLDLDPDLKNGGTVGQIVVFRHDDGTRKCLGKSIAALVS